MLEALRRLIELRNPRKYPELHPDIPAIVLVGDYALLRARWRV